MLHVISYGLDPRPRLRPVKATMVETEWCSWHSRGVASTRARATVDGAHAGGTFHSRRACAPQVTSPRRPGTVLPGRHGGLLRDTAAEQTTTLGLRKFAP